MTDDPRATPSERFASLAHETRLAIVRELGGPADDGDGYVTLPFSALQHRVGVEDNGRFAYHLGKLRGTFVERVDEGYRLTRPGVDIYQAILAGAYSVREDLGPFDTDLPCLDDDCEGTLRCEYADDRFRLWCGGCDELLVEYVLVAGCFGDDLPANLLSTASKRIKRDMLSLHQGYCPYCAGSVEFRALGPVRNLQWCESEHLFRHDCTRCHWWMRTRASRVALVLPQVVAAFASEGVDLFEWPHWGARADREEEVLSRDPLKIRVRITVEGVTREVILGPELRVESIEAPE